MSGCKRELYGLTRNSSRALYLKSGHKYSYAVSVAMSMSS